MQAVRVLLLGLVASGRASAQPGSEVIRRVHGLVVNGVSGAPVGRALVMTADQRMAQMTDSEGRFEFEVRLPPASPNILRAEEGAAGSFDPDARVFLMARKPGYRAMDRPAIVWLNNTTALQETIRVPLVPEAIVAGYVSREKTEPPAGVMVQLMYRQVEDGHGVWRAMQMQPTNGQGEYRFADLPAGDYKVVTREWTERNAAAQGEPALGYPPAAYPSGADESTAGLVHAAAGESVRADLALRAVPYYPIDIPVANAARAPGVGVSVLDATGGTGFSLGFDQRTQRVAGSLPAGSYRLLLTSYGERPLMASVNLTVGGPVRGRPILLVPGATVRVVVREEFTAKPGKEQGFSTGGASRVGEELIPRPVDVYLQPVGAEPQGGFALRNSAPGKHALNEGLVIENVPPRNYWVRTTARRGYVMLATVNGEDVLRKPLTLASGSGGVTLEVTLRDDVAVLSGTVSYLAGKGLGGLLAVWCYPLNGAGQPVQTFVDPQGHFLNASMPPGKYVVVVSDKPVQEVEYRDEEVLKRLAGTGNVVTLAPGETATVALQFTGVSE